MDSVFACHAKSGCPFFSENTGPISSLFSEKYGLGVHLEKNEPTFESCCKGLAGRAKMDWGLGWGLVTGPCTAY